MTSAEPEKANAMDAVRLEPVDVSQIAGLREDDCSAAYAAFRRQACEILDRGAGFSRLVQFGGRREDWIPVCETALRDHEPYQFFSTQFRAFRIHAAERPQGLFTGYFEPEAQGSRTSSPEYPVPIYRKPLDLVTLSEKEEQLLGLKYGRRQNGAVLPYIERKSIEQGALAGKGLEICWLKNWVDAFFIHIQGSGRVRLPDGSSLRLSYAAKTGLPYTGVGGVLAERGILSRETMSMQTVKAWMAAHPADARELMWLNKSFVFFREISVPNEALGAVGAAQVNLTPYRSMAVDRANWMFGTPMWIETSYPPEAGRADPRLQRLMIAQDTGSAIKGFVRGDFYWGWGEDAALIAGHMKSEGKMTVLLPKQVCLHLGLPA
jgi:membrane-bound lytic murein transglycosylase A